MEKVKKYILPTIIIFFFMATNGFAENMKGVFIPIFKTDFAVNNKAIGTFLMISSLGYIIFQYIGGIIIGKVGYKNMYIISLTGFVISLIGMHFSGNFIMLATATFLFSASTSFYNITTNSLIPIMFIGYQAIFLNLTHFCYGFGEAIGQKATGSFLQIGFSWRNLYLMIGIIYILILIVLIFVKLPEIEKYEKVKSVQGSDILENKNMSLIELIIKHVKEFNELMSNKIVLLYIFGLGFYIFAEMSVSNWYVNFLETTYRFSKITASNYIAYFFIIFTLGRLVGGFVVEKVGYFRSLIITIPIAAIMFLIGLIGGQKYLMFISISGIFFSIVYATCVVTINNTFKENTPYILGTIMTFASAVSMFLNFFMGYLNDAVGAYKSFYAIPTSLMISFIALFMIHNKLKNTKKLT